MTQPISSPTGICFPRRQSSGFTATINIIAFINVSCSRTLECSGDCNETPSNCNKSEDCSYRVGGGNLSFTFRFTKIGNDYLCSNIAQFNERFQIFNSKLQDKLSANTLDQVKPLPDGSCTKTVPDGNDKCGRPKFKNITNKITRAFKIKKEPSADIQKSITSQDADCNFA